ncbi:hypothetical protein EVAR_24642_1 [Eumeta japonica]|uniref:Uncharacterized protein n=1 Tax=Eumeta variegata TaxID=151549 RepID=A0A4C1V117_EUMVA|nr:hypothetical protein EVAR_24642_1 [Eumeta japonica]
MSSTHIWEHGMNENLNESSCEREKINEEIENLHVDTRFDRVDAPSAASALVTIHGSLAENIFFAKVNNCVASIRILNKLRYLSTPELTDEIVVEFNDILKFKKVEYMDSQDTDEPKLVMLSYFLNNIGDQCSVSMPIAAAGIQGLRGHDVRVKRTRLIL